MERQIFSFSNAISENHSIKIFTHKAHISQLTSSLTEHLNLVALKIDSIDIFKSMINSLTDTKA